MALLKILLLWEEKGKSQRYNYKGVMDSWALSAFIFLFHMITLEYVRGARIGSCSRRMLSKHPLLGIMISKKKDYFVLLITVVVIKPLYFKQESFRSDLDGCSLTSVNQRNVLYHLLTLFQNVILSMVVSFLWGKRNLFLHPHCYHIHQSTSENSCF